MKSALFNVLRKGNGSPVSASASAEESPRGFPRQVIPGEKWGWRKSKQIAARPAHGAETSVALVEATPKTGEEEARSQENTSGGQEPWSGGVDVCCACC